MKIEIDRKPESKKIERLGIKNWPIWEKEVSEFPWSYDIRETCYIISGKVTVTPNGGEPVQIESGDLVVFPEGMSCTWNITEDIKKHYNFD